MDTLYKFFFFFFFFLYGLIKVTMQQQSFVVVFFAGGRGWGWGGGGGLRDCDKMIFSRFVVNLRHIFRHFLLSNSVYVITKAAAFQVIFEA